MKDNIDPNESIEGVWCIDSETSERCLIDRKTNKILVRLPRNCKCLEDNRPSKQENK